MVIFVYFSDFQCKIFDVELYFYWQVLEHLCITCYHRKYNLIGFSKECGVLYAVVWNHEVPTQQNKSSFDHKYKTLTSNQK